MSFPVNPQQPSLSTTEWTDTVRKAPGWTEIVKKKSDLLAYYQGMSGNHLKYMLDGNHVEPEVVKEVKQWAKKKLIQEAKEQRDEDIISQIKENPMEDDDAGQDFEEAQQNRVTRKILRGVTGNVFETGFADRFDGEVPDPNPITGNINAAERYTLMGSATMDTLANYSGRQDAKAALAQLRIGQKTAAAARKQMYDASVFALQNAAPSMTEREVNPLMWRVDNNTNNEAIGGDDYMEAFFRR